MKIVQVENKDTILIEKIYKSEMEIFGKMGGADMWLLKSFIRCGKLYALVDENDNLISVAEYQGIMQKNEAYLYGFFTLPLARGKGYGKFLLEKTHEKLKRIGIKKIYLTVDPENKNGIKMYEQLGYKIEEFNKDEYGEGIHRYLMLKIL